MEKTARKIIIDTREQAPLPIPAELTIRRVLRTGDYSVDGYERLFAVERKSLQDLVQTIIRERERFEYELLRLSNYRFCRVLVEAPVADIADATEFAFSQANPKSVLHSVWAFEARYGVPFIFAGGRRAAARMLLGWAEFFAREVEAPRGW